MFLEERLVDTPALVTTLERSRRPPPPSRRPSKGRNRTAVNAVCGARTSVAIAQSHTVAVTHSGLMEEKGLNFHLFCLFVCLHEGINSKSSKVKSETQPYVVKLSKSTGANSSPTKGQQILKAIYGVLNSSK